MFLILVGGCITRENKQNYSKIFNMGSLHGYMLTHPQYSLNIFVDAIYQYKPDIILTEVRPEYPGPIDGSIDGGIEQSIIYGIGELENIKIVPIDWFDDEYISLMNAEEEKKVTDQRVKEYIEPHFKEYFKKLQEESFEILNSEENNKLVRHEYALYEKFGYKASKIRNINICKNLIKALDDNQGKKILTIFGLDHKYYLDDCVKDQFIEVLELKSWYDKNRINPIKKEIIELSIKNLNHAKAILKQRIESNFYSGDYGQKIAKKIESFDKWINAIRSLK